MAAQSSCPIGESPEKSGHGSVEGPLERILASGEQEQKASPSTSVSQGAKSSVWADALVVALLMDDSVAIRSS